MCVDFGGPHGRDVLLWKKRLSSDGQQLHQYQHNGQSPLTLNRWTWKKTVAYDVGDLGPDWGHAANQLKWETNIICLSTIVSEDYVRIKKIFPPLES